MLRGITDGTENCECHRCIQEGAKSVDFGEGWVMPLSACKMILCGECGNKRCPKASDHRLACTNSNEQGQPGSIYRRAFA
jgi:hypothetical protein